jgi:hypothetical protein
MKMVYTNENRFIVANASNILESQGIELILKNEFASGAIGEISAFDAWVELWVVDDSDYDKACKILAGALSEEGASEWLCKHCKEKNDASFETCWKCQNERSPA